MALSPDLKHSYVEIIDRILANSDINTVSEKRIRKGLQDETGHDLLPYKAEIKDLIMLRFDVFAQQAEAEAEAEASVATVTGGRKATPSVSPELSPASQKPSEGSSASDEIDETTHPKKKRKSELIDADAAYAAKLQAEENSLARPTRASRKAAPVKKKTAKPRTSKKVKVSDDSDMEGAASEPKKEVNRTGGFHKPMNLSPPLSALFDGEISLSRPQAVKRLWNYIRENDLQDPADRRQIRCDERMRAVFKLERVHMFTMTKLLNQNLYNPDE